MNGVSKTELAIIAIQERDTKRPDRYLDMQVAVVLSGEVRPSLRVGGRWDAKERRYDGPAETEHVITLAASQLEGWADYTAWLQRYLMFRRHLANGLVIDDALAQAWPDGDYWFTGQWYGGRRAGKTYLACVAMVLALIAMPGAHAIAVSPTEPKLLELLALLEGKLVPAEWRAYARGVLRLANGSYLRLQTGRVPELKAQEQSPVIAVLNEAQEQPKRNWLDMQGNLVDLAGLCILAQNPPRTNRGLWTQELFDETKKGERPTVRTVWFNPALNPYKSQAALGALAGAMDEREAKREIGGDMGVAVGDVALTAWSDSEHVIGWIPSTWEDVTEDVTARMFGRPYAQIGGLDWDKGPGPSYSLGRLFRPHNAPSWALIFVVEHGQRFKGLPEERFAEHLATLLDKYGRPIAHPTSTIWIGDASGSWQSSKRKHDAADDPSWKRMTRAGWEVTYPDPVERRNPRRIDRFELINSYVLPRQPSINRPRVVMLADSARHVIEASRHLPRRKLEADRWNEHAHIVDTWTYLAWRLFSREYQDLSHGVPEAVARNSARGILG